jgi:hypothetical protein
MGSSGDYAGERGDKWRFICAADPDFNPVAAFFIPGVDAPAPALEDSYVQMRHEVEVDLGRCPSDRRILDLWARRGSVDCHTEVGRPDPIHGGRVLAIFDLGTHQPFVVYREVEDPAQIGVYDVLDCTAYSVLEFES